MVCPNCDKEVVEGYAFCPFCGTQLPTAPEPEPEPEPEPKPAPEPELESAGEIETAFAPDPNIEDSNPYLGALDDELAPSTMDFVEDNIDYEYKPPSLMDDEELEEDEAEITADLAPWIDQIEAGSITIGAQGDEKAGHPAESSGVMEGWQLEEARKHGEGAGESAGATGKGPDETIGDTGFFELQSQLHQQAVSIYTGDNTDVELLKSNNALGKVGPKKQGAMRRDNFEIPKSQNELLLFGGIVLALLAVIWLGVSALLPSHGDAPADQEAATEQTTEAAEGETAEGEAAEGEGEDEQAPAVEAKAGLGDYSWGELGAIAAEIEACASREEALEVAARYNLVDGEHHMLGNTINVPVADNLEVPFAIVDVYHDDKADGSGKAGLTFLSYAPVTVRSVNTESTNEGGWEASDLRTYLADYSYLVPSELDAVVVEVTKSTNNTGYSADPACVTSTSERYWAPSFAEVAGSAGWAWESDPGNTDNYNAILNSEGSQYALFAERGVVADGYNEVLIYRVNDQPVQWWLRSPSPSNGTRFRLVTADGNPSMPGETVEEHGIVMGFAL